MIIPFLVQELRKCRGDGLHTGTTQPCVSGSLLGSMVPGVGYPVPVGFVRFFPGCKVSILGKLRRKHAAVSMHAVPTTKVDSKASSI